MQIDNKSKLIIDQLDRPAFFTKDAKIVYANALALSLDFTEGLEIYQFTGINPSSYKNNWKRVDNLKVHRGVCHFTANVSQIEDMELFLLNQKAGTSELQALQLAATKLRQPIFDLMNSLDAIRLDPNAQENFNDAIKFIHQLDRTVLNMDCANKYRGRSFHPERTEFCAFVKELCEKIQVYLEVTNVTFTYTIPDELCFTDLDQSMFTNAFMNMVTNAMNTGATTLVAEFRCTDEAIMVSLTDNGPLKIRHLRMDIFNQFLREPIIADNHMGLGLGMVIIHATALAHGGSLFMDECNVDELRITMRIPITKPNAELKQKPSLIIEKNGGLDPVMVHLSAYLPADKYER